MPSETSMNRLRVVFMGSPEFAIPSLEATVARCDVQAVYCQPDRPAGRGRKLRAPALKLRALEMGLEVRQPEKVRAPEVIAELGEMNLDLILVAAYGQIFPKALLELPRFGCVNVHGSLLPRWRGAAPIQRAIMAGDPSTGISIMQMDIGCDTGAVHTKTPLRIADDETCGQLFERMAVLGGTALDEFLVRFNPEAPPKPHPQDETLATHAAKISKDETWLDWQQSAVGIARTCRGLDPAPGARARLCEREFKLFDATIADPPEVTGESPKVGEVVSITKAGLDVQTGDGVVRFQSIQLPGKRRLPVSASLQSLSIELGQRFELPSLQSQ